MISWKYVQPLLSDSVKRNLKLNVAARKIHELHPSDLADIIEELDRTQPDPPSSAPSTSRPPPRRWRRSRTLNSRSP